MLNLTPEEKEKYKDFFTSLEGDVDFNSSPRLSRLDLNNPIHREFYKKINEEVIKPKLESGSPIQYGGVNFHKNKEDMVKAQQDFFNRKKEPLQVEEIKPTQKIEDIDLQQRKPQNPIDFEAIAEKPTPEYAAGDISSKRGKTARFEGEEEKSSPSVYDTLLKKFRDDSPDVAVRKQVWNPITGTLELSQDTKMVRPLSDMLFGSPEEKAAKTTETYSKLKQKEQEQTDLAKLDSSGNRLEIAKNPMLASIEKTLGQKTPELSRSIASVTESPTTDGTPVVSEIASIKQQKVAPVARSSVSTGVKEDTSPQAALNEAIKAESQKTQQPEIDFVDLLRRAQEARGKTELLANIGKAGETLGAGITGIVPGGVVTKTTGKDFYDSLIKQAKEPIEDVGDMYTIKTKQDEMQRLARRRDPSSDESKFARDLMKQQGITVPEGATAEALEKYAPQLTNILNQREARIARADDARQRALDRETIRQQTAENKMQENLNKGFKEMSGKLVSELASSRSSFGKSAGILRSAEAMETFIKNINPKNITTRQIYELARGLDSMLSQGASTISGTNKLIPETYSSDLAKIQEYITRIPKGAGQEQFVKQMMETVDREKKLANFQVQKTQKKILSGYSHLKKADPERYKDILIANELPSDDETSISEQPLPVQTKTVVKRGYNKKTDQTQLIYSDGSSEIVEGRK